MQHETCSWREAPCDSRASSRGLCHRHYQAARTAGHLQDYEMAPRHRVQNVEDGAGVCLSCGPTKVYWHQAKRYWVCLKGEKSRDHGLSWHERDRIVGSAGECGICGATESLVVDHCHTRLEVRGVLCGRCNTGLGMFRDRPDLLRLAAAYLD